MAYYSDYLLMAGYLTFTGLARGFCPSLLFLSWAVGFSGLQVALIDVYDFTSGFTNWVTWISVFRRGICLSGLFSLALCCVHLSLSILCINITQNKKDSFFSLGFLLTWG